MNDDEKVTYFGETDARNRRVRFGIKKKDRSRHMYVIGKTAMGKSTLLENLAIQDIQNGEGLAFIDPHGKTADLLLEYVPEHRIRDVIYFAPFDLDFPISFNVLEDVGAERRHLVVSGLMTAFKKIWVDAWSARMEYILTNILLALLEYPGSTLMGVNRMLTDKDFRTTIVNNITDPSVKAFWTEEYAKYTDKFAAEAAPAIQNKVGQFVANPLVRNIIGQSKSSFDIRKIMDEKKILIINLSKGRVGDSNANLIGAMLITKIYLAAMSRADLGEKEMKEAAQFYLYVDEFQSFANESFADILSEARKYKLSLIIAHQYIEQMTDEVRAAVFGNVGTMVTYRVGSYDAAVFEKEFAPQFSAEDMVNLQQYQMYLKLMIDQVTSVPFSAMGMPPIPKPPQIYVHEIISASREQFASPRAEVENEIRRWHIEKIQPVGGTAPSSASHGDSSFQGGGNNGGGNRDGGRGGFSGAQSGGSNNGFGNNFNKPQYPSAGGNKGGARDGGPSRDGGRDSTRDGARDGARDFNREGGRDSSRNMTRDGGNRDAGPRRDAPQRENNSPETIRRDMNRTDGALRENGFQPHPKAPLEAQNYPREGGNDRGRQTYSNTQNNQQNSSGGADRRNTDAGQSVPDRYQPQATRDGARDGIRDNSNRDFGRKSRENEDREKSLREAISLNYLKDKKEDEQRTKNQDKNPKPENLLALKNALLGLLGDDAKTSNDPVAGVDDNVSDKNNGNAIGNNQGNSDRNHDNNNTQGNDDGFVDLKELAKLTVVQKPVDINAGRNFDTNVSAGNTDRVEPRFNSADQSSLPKTTAQTHPQTDSEAPQQTRPQAQTFQNQTEASQKDVINESVNVEVKEPAQNVAQSTVQNSTAKTQNGEVDFDTLSKLLGK